MLTFHQQVMRGWETMAFADNLRRRRIAQFLSQAELARRAGLHALTITRLEAGTTAPSTRTVRALAEALGVQPHDLATPFEVVELRRVLGQAGPKGGAPAKRRGGPEGGVALARGGH
jgi:transcriptional regulator with XRE-family HTH domain